MTFFVDLIPGCVEDLRAEDVDWSSLANALKLLPKAHYNTLKYLAEHLHRLVCVCVMRACVCIVQLTRCVKFIPQVVCYAMNHLFC